MDTNVVATTKIAEKSVDSTITTKWFESKIMTIKELIDAKINCSMAYQRPSDIGCWKKSETIDSLVKSILLGRSIDAITLRFAELLEAINGKQRLSSIEKVYGGFHIVSTLQDELAELNGKMFSQWPQEFQQKFLNHPVMIAMVYEDNEDVISDFFRDMNQGAAKLTPAQANKAALLPIYTRYTSIIAELQRIQYAEKPELSFYQDCFLQLLAIDRGNFSLAAKDVVAYALTMPATDFDENRQLAMGIAVETFLQAIALFPEGENDVLKRILKKVHIVSIISALIKLPKWAAEAVFISLRKEFSQLRTERSIAKVEYDACNKNATASAENTKNRITGMIKLLSKVPCDKKVVDLSENLPEKHAQLDGGPAEQPKSNVKKLTKEESAAKVKSEKAESKAQRKAAYEASQKRNKMSPFATDAWNANITAA